MTHHYLLANVQDMGIHEATKAGWQQTDKVGVFPGLLTPDGQPVAVTSSADHLADLPPEVTIYLASRWLHAYGNPRTVLQAHRAQGGKVLYLNGEEADWL